MHMVEQTQRSVIWVTLAILIGPNGISFFNFVVERLPLVEIAGRSLAVMSGEDDLGRSYCQCPPGVCGKSEKETKKEHTRCGPRCRGAKGGCFACISAIDGNAGHVLGMGVIVRTDLEAMQRLKDVKLGVKHGEKPHHEIVGRPMHERPEIQKQREAEREHMRRYEEERERERPRYEERGERYPTYAERYGREYEPRYGYGREKAERYEKPSREREYGREQPEYGYGREREHERERGESLWSQLRHAFTGEPSRRGEEGRRAYGEQYGGYEPKEAGWGRSGWEKEKEEQPSWMGQRRGEEGYGRDIGSKIRYSDHRRQLQPGYEGRSEY